MQHPRFERRAVPRPLPCLSRPHHLARITLQCTCSARWAGHSVDDVQGARGRSAHDLAPRGCACLLQGPDACDHRLRWAARIHYACDLHPVAPGGKALGAWGLAPFIDSSTAAACRRVVGRLLLRVRARQGLALSLARQGAAVTWLEHAQRGAGGRDGEQSSARCSPLLTAAASEHGSATRLSAPPPDRVRYERRAAPEPPAPNPAPTRRGCHEGRTARVNCCELCSALRSAPLGLWG